MRALESNSQAPAVCRVGGHSITGGCAPRGRVHAPSADRGARARQELFPQSYAQTAAWLQRERTANQDMLARCRAALQAALGTNAALQPLVAGCQVRRGGRRPWK